MSEENKRVLDIENIFDDIIKNGYKSKEKEIIPGLKVKLKPLSYNELSRAEAEISRRNRDIPADITVKLRCGKILSYAIISINGSLIDDAENPENNDDRRICLYDKLVTGPSVIVNYAYQLYLDSVDEENKFYMQPEAIADEIENF